MIKSLVLIAFVAFLLTGCKKDTMIPPVQNNSATQVDSLGPYLGSFKGILHWSVAGGSSGSDTVMLTTSESADKSLLYVNEGSSSYPFDAASVIRHKEANSSSPGSDLKFSQDSLYMFVMQGPRFYHYYCKKQ